MKRKNPTKKHSKEFWNHHLDAWYSSGFSQSQYCRENDINSRAFSYHKMKEDFIPYMPQNIDKQIVETLRSKYQS